MRARRALWAAGLLLCVAGTAARAGRGPDLFTEPSAPQPMKVKPAEFKAVVMDHVKFGPAVPEAAANKKAGRKIDEVLFNKMRLVFPEMQEGAPSSDLGADDRTKGKRQPEPAAAAPVAAPAGEAAPTAGRTLLIEPTITALKFIGGGARFMVGAMAGNSGVKMKVTFRDKASGDVVAEVEFLRRAGAFAGAGSMGGADNMMLEVICDDVANYVRLNK